MRGFQKPPPGSRLIPGHPSAAGLLWYPLLSDAGGGDVPGVSAYLADLSPQHNPVVASPAPGLSASSGWTQGSANYGAGVVAGTIPGGSNRPFYTSQRVAVGSVRQITLMAAVNLASTQPNSFAGVLQAGLVGTSGTGTIVGVGLNGTALQPVIAWSGSPSTVGTTGVTLPAATDTMFAITFDGATGKYVSYGLGQAPVSGTGNTQPAYDFAASSAQWVLGHDPRFGTGRLLAGTIYWGIAWGRVLPASEIVSFFAEPYRMIAPPLARRYFLFGLPVAGGLTALSGGATIDETAAGVPVARATVSGTATLDFGAAGGPTIAAPLRGTADLAIAGGGALTATQALAGQATLDLVAGGAPEAIAYLAGRSSADLTGAGAPIVTIRLTGSGSADLDAAGTLSRTGTLLLTGAARLDLTALGLPGATARIAGRATLDATAAGQPATGADLAGGAAFDITAAGAPTVQLALAGRATVDLGGGFDGILSPQAVAADGGPAVATWTAAVSAATSWNGEI